KLSCIFFFSSRRRHTRWPRDWSSDVCSSDLSVKKQLVAALMHSEYAENSDLIAEVEDKVVRAEIAGWPDRENQGYIGFSLTATSKTLRQEPRLLHVLLTIQVDEGQQRRLKEIGFRYVGTEPATARLDSVNLRKLIPLNDGEVYNR